MFIYERISYIGVYIYALCFSVSTKHLAVYDRVTTFWINDVVDAYEEALLSRFPRARYPGRQGRSLPLAAAADASRMDFRYGHGKNGLRSSAPSGNLRQPALALNYLNA